jgi:hypothetical protein
MFEFIGSVLTGGATGLLGTAISHVFSYFKDKQKNQHTLAIMREERETIKMEIEGRERVASIEAESAKDIAESKVFAASMNADKARYSSGESQWLVMVDVVRGLIRPVLTIGLVIFVGIIWATSDNPAIDNQIVTTVLYVCTAAVLWWFGTRVKQQN